MRGTALRVGGLLLGSVVALVGVLLLLGGNPFARGTGYETYFRESVQGLDVGAAVRYRGVALGRVTRVALAGAEYGGGSAGAAEPMLRLVMVRFVLDDARTAGLPDAAAAVRDGLRVRLATPGLTGPRFLELDFLAAPGHPPEPLPWTPRDPYIPSVPSTIAVVETGAERLLEQLGHVDIAGLANGLGALVTLLRADLGDGTAGSSGQAGQIHTALAQATDTLRLTAETIRAADLPGLTAAVHRTASDADALLRGRQLHDLLASATAATDHLAAASIRLAPLLATLQGTAGRADDEVSDLQARLDPILRDARAAAQDLRETADAARRDPGQLLFGGPPPRDPAR